MKKYYIYDFQTDEKLCEIEAGSIVDAEVKACVLLNKSQGIQRYKLWLKC